MNRLKSLGGAAMATTADVARRSSHLWSGLVAGGLETVACSNCAVRLSRSATVAPAVHKCTSYSCRYSVQYSMYRHFSLKYTIDLYCGLKFRHAVGFLICSVGLKFINTAVLYSVLRPGWLLLRHTVGC
jgi:hypothetical protein